MKPNTLHVRLMPLVCALLSVLPFANVRAQKPVEHDLKITFASNITLAQTKFIHEGLRAQDPDALVWVSVDDRHAYVRCHLMLDRPALQHDLDPSGLHIVRILEVGEGAVREEDIDPNEAPPSFVNTGDERMDDLRYEIAKRSWLQEHPNGSNTLATPDNDR